MSVKSEGASFDVLITSERESFWQDVKTILKGYYPYKLHFMGNADAILSPVEQITPQLALIDGYGGTNSASEWVQSVKMTYPDCPVIVLYGPDDHLDFAVVKKNGANFIMHVNYDREFVSDMILKLAPVELKGTDIPTSAIMPIDLKDVNQAEAINFDLYIHLPSNEKSFRVRKDGGTIDQRLFDKSSETHQRLYIKKTQIKAFFEYARTVLTMRNEVNPVPLTEKVYKSKQLIHEIISEFLNSEASDFQAGKVIFERCRQILTELELLKEKSPEARVEEVFRFTGHTRSTYQDAINMAVFASNFASLLGFDGPKVENAALAGLLHNVGLAQMPLSIIGKNIAQYSPEELAKYHTYPDSSVVLIKSKKVPLPQEVSSAIVQHQELGDGTGFPHKLSADKIDPLSKVLRLATRFLELTSLDGEQIGLTPKAALTKIKEEAISGKATVDMVTATTIYKRMGGGK